MPTYRSNAVAARITPCQDTACECRQWTAPGPDSEEAVRAGKPADAWYSVLIDARDYRIVHEDGEQSSDSGYGVALRNLPIVRLRRVGDAAHAQPTALDRLATTLTINRLSGRL
ncbi:hypothetical protein [Nocardia sp. NPDC056000]|uniref:hypothetical protein n=1 Tax=Nocardia sp. NPDC056000 TaxID=3345674 RepID=UPI0035DC76C9